MAVEKLGLMRYRSTLLPFAEFESIEAARHYDTRAAMQLKGATERTAAKVEKLSEEEFRDQILTFAATIEDIRNAPDEAEERNYFLAARPECITEGTEGSENFIALRTHLRTKGVVQPTSLDMVSAWDELKNAGAVHVKKGKRRA